MRKNNNENKKTKTSPCADLVLCDVGKEAGAGHIVGVSKEDESKVICSPKGRSARLLPNNNVGVIGASGTGKAGSFFLPNILNSAAAEEAMLVFDETGMLYEQATPILERHGYETHIIEPGSYYIKESDGWDCLNLIRESDTPELLASRVSEMILKNLGGADTPYWSNASCNLLALCILYVACSEGFAHLSGSFAENKEGRPSRTFRDVAKLLSKRPSKIRECIGEAIEKSEYDRRLLGSRYSAWIADYNCEQIALLLSVSLSGTLYAATDILSRNEIVIDSLLGKTAIFVKTCARDKLGSAFSALFFDSVMTRMMEIAGLSKSQTLERRLQFYISEAGSIGRIPDFAKYLCICRSYNIGIFYSAQSIDGLYSLYAEDGSSDAWRMILASTPLQLFLGANDEVTTAYFSKRTGVVDVEDVFKAKKGRPLFDTDDLRSLNFKEFLVSTDNSAFLADKYWWGDHPLAKDTCSEEG